MDSTAYQTNKAADASDIVAAALDREGIKPSGMGVFGEDYLFLVRGRPHVSAGFRALLETPVALLVALWQAAFMYAFVHDAVQFFRHGHNTIWLHHIPRGVWFGIERLDTAVFFFLAASVPLFVLNLGWGLMAAAITGRLRPVILLSGLTGLVPLRAFASRLMPLDRTSNRSGGRYL